MGLFEQGRVEFGDFQTYYEIYGPAESSKPPLLAVHGGPGAGHNVILGLADLATDGRQVVFYDQLGSGLSDHPDDDSLWTIETFVEELKAVRQQLGLDEVHLFGHSWGGMLSIEYLLTRPEGVHSAILASAMVSLPLYQAEVETLKQALDPDVYQTLKKHEAAGTTDTNEYRKAYEHFRAAHIYRQKEPYPSKFRAPEGTVGNAAYTKMWGASEAWANGTLRSWDVTGRLGEITVPTLITAGEFDELTPHQAKITRDGIPSSEIVIFGGGSHLVHIEQQTKYLAIVGEFLNEVETKES